MAFHVQGTVYTRTYRYIRNVQYMCKGTITTVDCTVHVIHHRFPTVLVLSVCADVVSVCLCSLFLCIGDVQIAISLESSFFTLSLQRFTLALLARLVGSIIYWHKMCWDNRRMQYHWEPLQVRATAVVLHHWKIHDRISPLIRCDISYTYLYVHGALNGTAFACFNALFVSIQCL